MDFEKIERFDLEQGRGWDSGGALLVATQHDGDWVRSEVFDALLAAYRETRKALEIAAEDPRLEATSGYEVEEWIAKAREVAAVCDERSPRDKSRCQREAGHEGRHASRNDGWFTKARTELSQPAAERNNAK